MEALATPVAYKLANTPVRSWPFPHLEIEDLLPRPLFDALRSLNITDRLVSRSTTVAAAKIQPSPERYHLSLTDRFGGSAVANEPVLAAAVGALCHSIVARALITRFQHVISKRFDGEIPLFHHSLEYIDDRTGYALPPHTDAPRKLVTLLLYLADEGADPELGTALYALRSGRTLPIGLPTERSFLASDMVEAHRVPYRPNRAIVFAPTTNSLHGVPRVAELRYPRRLLQYQCVAIPKARSETAEPTAS